jgi:hypothetical protein
MRLKVEPLAGATLCYLIGMVLRGIVLPVALIFVALRPPDALENLGVLTVVLLGTVFSFWLLMVVGNAVLLLFKILILEGGVLVWRLARALSRR